MEIVQNLMARLRPLVGLKAWDYCVLWKLCEDQRFIEWMDCCCGGADHDSFENGGGGEEIHYTSCRDVMFQHPRTKSCEFLAQLPSSITIDSSNIHGQTLISNQPSWLNLSNISEFNDLEEPVASRVLIPVAGGLIELFVTKQVTEDQNVIDFVTSQCNILLEQEAIMNSTNMEANFSVNVHPINDLEHKHYDLTTDDNVLKDSNDLCMPYDVNVDRTRLCSSPMNFLPQFNNFSSETNKMKIDHNSTFYEGSHDLFMCDKNNEVQDMDTIQNAMMNNNIGVHNMQCLDTKQQGSIEKESFKHHNGLSGSVSDCSDRDQFDDGDAKYRKRNGKGPQSKNLVAERNRRKKLNDRLYTLRSLVPNISKLDRASILGDAIKYVKELQKQSKELEDELEENSEMEDSYLRHKTNNVQPVISITQNETIPSNGFHLPVSSCNGILENGNGYVSKPIKDPEGANDKGQQMEPQVDVAQIEGNEFFVKVICEHKAGGFTRLLEALDSLGLEVTNANVTSFRSLVSNVFEVKRRDSEIIQADHVRDSLLEITKNPSRGWSDQMANESPDSNNNGMDHHHHHHHIHHDHDHHQLDHYHD